MKINIENNIEETTVRQIDINVLDIIRGSDKIELTGDILYIVGDHPTVEDEIVRLYGQSNWSGSVVLAEGDGYKVVQVRGFYTEFTRYSVGSYANVGGEHRFYPGIDTPFVRDFLEGLWSTQMVGKRVYMINPLLPPPSEIDFRISAVGEDGTGKYYVFSDYTNGPAGPNIEFWFDENLYTTDYIPTSIKLTTSEAALAERPDSTIDVASYWELIRSVWDNLEDEDRELIEEVWQGFTEDVGNLMQRLYEIESAASVRDILIFRKSHWAFIDADYRVYKFHSGYTDRNNPNHFYDTSQAPFRMKVWPHEAHDVELYLTVEGKAYKITDVISPWEVVLENADFETKTGLNYAVGGILDDDIKLDKISYSSYSGLFNSGELINAPSGAFGFYVSNDQKYLYLSNVNQRFLPGETLSGLRGEFVITSPVNQEKVYIGTAPTETQIKTVRSFLSGENFFDLGIADIHFVEILNGIGLVRIYQKEISGGYTRASTSTRFYCNKPVFSRSCRGTWVTVDDLSYRVTDIDPNGYYVVLSGASFLSDQENISFSINPYDYSSWSDGETDGTATFIGSATESPFDSDYVNRIIFIGGVNNDFFTIIEVIDSQTVILDRPAVADLNVQWQLPVDAIVDLENGQIRRTNHGIIEDVSYLDILCNIRVKYRVPSDTDLAEIPTIQETVRLPDGSYTDVLTRVASEYETYLGHKNLTQASLTSARGVSLTQDVDYEIDMQNGTVEFLTNAVLVGENFQAIVEYNPYYGEEEDAYFVGGDGFIHFRENPKHILWAEASFLNKEDPYNKYGKLISFYQENSSAYHLALLALWVTYWTGPRPDYIERGLNILLGLPFAEKDGVVEYTTLRRVGLQDKWVVVILYSDGIRKEYELPNGLVPYVTAEETVEQFDILAGYSVTYYYTGRTLQESYRKSVIDDTNNPFFEGVIGGKLTIDSGLNEGVFTIVGRKSSSQVVLDRDLLKDDEFTFSIKTPALRVYDEVNYENFLQEIGDNALSRYYTENTTSAERELARSLLKKHLFLSQAEPPAFSEFPNVKDVLDFLRNIKPQYTDFIFQVLVREEDEFEIIDGDLLYDFTLDLTSTFRWHGGSLPQTIDPFFGSVIPHSYPSYKDGSVAGNVFTDTTNSPFTTADVGRYIWINTAYRYYENGSILTGSNDFNSTAGIFSASDVNKTIYIPSLDKTFRIIEYVNANLVRVDRSFSSTDPSLDFHVSHEVNRGIYEITSYVSASQVNIDTPLTTGSNMHYSIVDNIDLLDEEAIALFACGTVEVYDAGMTLLETISLDPCPP